MLNSKIKEFQKILASIQAKMDNLLDQLKAENQLLERHELDSIKELLVEKQKEFKSLNQTMITLQEFLESENLDFNSDSIKPFILKCPLETQSIWQRFIETLRECQEQNLINGLLIMGMKNYNDKLLGLLTHTPQTYDKNAKLSGSVSTREHKA